MRYILLLKVLLLLPLSVQACPDLARYYPLPGVETNWTELESRLRGIFQDCLDSSPYFALLGAAQLKSGNLPGALEFLERALLIDPENGAAQIDYAEALYAGGQIFAALELNQGLIQREDIPGALKSMMRDRQQRWNAMNRQQGYEIEISGAYSNNLNSAPSPSEITLTLAGEPVMLALAQDFQPIGGPYINLRLASRISYQRPRTQHNWLFEARGRVSEDSGSDLTQANGNYVFVRPGSMGSWQLHGGLSHLAYGGSPLFTALDLGARYQFETRSECKPYSSVSFQQQLYHSLERLNAVETKISLGGSCLTAQSIGNQLLNAELSVLGSNAMRRDRPGGNRRGWQASLEWQMESPAGLFRARFNYTRLRDRRFYSDLLADGAAREVSRRNVLLQYRRQVGPGIDLTLNLYHYLQDSNIDLFQSEDNALEIGLRLLF